MRRDAEWMNPIDDRILEALRAEGNLTPGALDEPLDVTVSDHAGDRLQVLAKYGLVERFSRGLYRLTDDGRAYLDGDLDASELEPSESSE